MSKTKARRPSTLGKLAPDPKDRPNQRTERSSAISEAIIVLGMHRSGTSAVSGTLMRLGGGTPKTLMPADPGNQRGYFESVALMEFHDELLQSADSSWQDWREFNPEWRRSAVAVDLRRRAKELFLTEFAGARLPVLKDPRICRFAPFWFEVLREMEIRPSIVIPVRSPLDVARSIGKAQGLTLTHGVLLWLRHVLDAEASSRNEARSIFAWQDFRENWRAVCERIGAQTHVAWPRLSDRTSRGVERFLTNELVHHNADHATLAAHGEVNEWTLRAYDALLELARNPQSNSALATLDEIRGLLNESSRIFGRLLVDLEVELEEVRNQANVAAAAGEARSEREVASRAEQAERTLEETLRDKTSLAETINQMIAERESLQQENARLAAELQSRESDRNEKISAPAENARRAEREREKTAPDRGTLATAIIERDLLQAERSALMTQLLSHRREVNEKTIALADFAQRLERAERELEAARSERAALAAELKSLAAALNANALALTEIQERAGGVNAPMRSCKTRN